MKGKKSIILLALLVLFIIILGVGYSEIRNKPEKNSQTSASTVPTSKASDSSSASTTPAKSNSGDVSSTSQITSDAVSSSNDTSTTSSSGASSTTISNVSKVSSNSGSTSNSSATNTSASTTVKSSLADLNDQGTHVGNYTISNDTGTFGSQDSSHPTKVTGDIAINYNASSSGLITLQNLNISGTLAVDFGVGTVTLNNVTVNGVEVTNVGPHSFRVIGNSSIQNLKINDSNNDAHVVVDGNANISHTTVLSGASLEVTSTATNNNPFAELTLSPVSKNQAINITGSFGIINVTTPANVNLQSSNINLLNVEGAATNTIINVSPTTKLSALNANSAISVLGTGTIETANLGVSGTTIQTAPIHTAVVTGVTAKIGGQDTNSGNTTTIVSVPTNYTVLNSIAITSPAVKLTYSIGDELDISGLKVTGTYSNNTSALQSISEANVTGFDSSKPAAKQVLTITVGNKTTNYTITVNAASQIFAGYIQDEDCYSYYVDPSTGIASEDPGDDSRGCLLMKSCAASGYGITVRQTDGTYKFYYLDGDFANLVGKTFTNGTVSQLAAWNLIQKTNALDHISIKVTGSLNGDTKVSPYDGISYPVITVSSLSESLLNKIAITSSASKLNYTVGDKLDITGLKVTGTYSDGTTSVIPVTKDDITGFDSSKIATGQVLTVTVGGKITTYTVDIIPKVQTFTGFVEDVHCFYAYTDPATDTKGCLSMKSCAASGYGITIKQNDATKIFYFFDGTFAQNGSTFTVGTGSQLIAWNLIQNTTKKNDVTVNVAGTFDGSQKTYVDSKGVSHSFPVLKVSSLSETSTLSSIAVTTPATKLTYSVGDKLDLTGLQVTGTYDDSSTALQAVSAANVTGFDSSTPVTGQVLTVTVGGKTTTYKVDIKAAELTFTGYIQDEDCFIGYAPDYGSDTKMCLLMKSCAASGYGITALQSDGSYKFYYFDGDFATLVGKTFTTGTGSQLEAWNLINNTTKKDHVAIKVTGTLTGDTKISPYDGISYPVITVTSLTEN